jgi:hypothetical protein
VSPPIEILESRLAPAAILPGGRTLKYVDLDGDQVALTISAGSLAESDFLFDTAFGTAGPQELQTIDFAGDAAKFGTKIKVVATPSDYDNDGDVEGDGFVNIGQLLAGGIDLGAVQIDGDLGRIIAGDTVSTTDGLKELTVNSLGRFGTDTGAADLDSEVTGRLGALTVKADIWGATITVDDATPGGAPFDGNPGIGKAKIGGSIFGGSTAESGGIFAQGEIGTLTVGGSIVGGAGEHSGFIESNRQIGTATVGGSIMGSSGNRSGQIEADDGFKSLKVVGSVSGSSGDGSGAILTDDTRSASVVIGGSVLGGTGEGSGLVDGGDQGFTKLKIGGSLIGGSMPETGAIEAGYLGTVTIEGSLIGGSISGATSLADSGYIKSFSSIKSLTIGGSIIAGTDNSTGSLVNCGAVLAYDDIGSLTVKGSLQGTVGTEENRVVIVAAGEAEPDAKHDVALGKLTVLGSVVRADVLAGWEPVNESAPVAVNPDAEIGKVKITGDWVASNLTAGVVSGGNGFGNALDAVISGLGIVDAPARIARIAGIVIGGQVLGTTVAGDHYGFVAQQIDSFKIRSVSFPLAAGASNDLVPGLPVGITGDGSVMEV